MSISIPLPRSAQAGMRLSVIEGCFAALPAAFSTGVFLTGFALLLGADAWALGLVAAIPAFGQSAQLLSAWLLGRWGHRKALTIWSASISRASDFEPSRPVPTTRTCKAALWEGAAKRWAICFQCSVDLRCGWK